MATAFSIPASEMPVPAMAASGVAISAPPCAVGRGMGLGEVVIATWVAPLVFDDGSPSASATRAASALGAISGSAGLGATTATPGFAILKPMSNSSAIFSLRIGVDVPPRIVPISRTPLRSALAVKQKPALLVKPVLIPSAPS